jgi:ubiquinone/menaquinone biosynthesis C-methylase UbiE
VAQKQELTEGYDRSARQYDQVVGQQYLMGIWGLLPFVSLPPAPAILDAGCGTGSILLEAARLFYPCRLLVGVDLSPGMVAEARRKAAAQGIPATFLVGDVERLPFAPGTFDLVICSGVYHWFDDRQAALREFARTLRPGGQLVLTAVAAPGYSEWIQLCRIVWKNLFGPPAEPWFPALPTAKELASQLMEAGFRIKLLDHPVHRVVIEHPEHFVRYMATTAPNWLAGVPGGAEEWVQQELLRTMRTLFPAGFPCTSASLLAVAERL